MTRVCGICGRRIRPGEKKSYRVTVVTPLDTVTGGRLHCWFCSDCFAGDQMMEIRNASAS